MSITRGFILVGIALGIFLQCTTKKDAFTVIRQDVISGVSVVAPAEEFPENPMPAIEAVSADWVAVIPYAFTLKGSTEVVYNQPLQWWGERPEGVIRTIQLAKESGLKIMLKPQVWVPGGWPGDIDFDSEAQWQQWENSYKDYLDFYVKIADSLEVEMICIGTEFKHSEQKRPQYWHTLIKDIRSTYDGKLTYAANWDCFEKITFWKDLDYIGIDAYFPLSNAKTPSKPDLISAWKTPKKSIENIARKFNKPILFTEYGYLSVDGAAGETWTLEAQLEELAINEEAQAIALDAFFEVWHKEQYWHGGFLWKWFPNEEGTSSHLLKEHTPQDKMGEAIVRDWYKKM